MDEKELVNQLINPYYAINIDPNLATDHQLQVTEDQWIATNFKLIDEIGLHEWLQRLLSVLQGDYPRTPDDTDPGDDY